MDNSNQAAESLSTNRLSNWRAALFSSVTILLLLCLIEGGWQLACYLGWLDPPARNRDVREEWQWVERHRHLGPEGFSITAARYDPILGWRPNPNFQADGVFINALGQRGEKVIPYERTPDRLRILFIGDSYTYGAQVRDDETFSALLGSHYLPEAETINLGVSGYGTDQQILFYETEGIKYKPDIVVLGFFVHDISRNDGAFRYYAKPAFDLKDGELALADTRIISPTDLLELYQTGQRKIRPQGFCISEALMKSIDQSSRSKVLESSHAWQVTSRLLERFRKRVLAEGAHPLLLIIPHSEFLREKGSRSELISKLAKDRAEEIGLEYLDMGPILIEEREKDPSTPLYDGHWTVRGHEVAAQALFKVIEQLGWQESAQQNLKLEN